MTDTRIPAPLIRLNGAVQHYEWGGYGFIPALLGVTNAERKPFAELWIGAHRNAPSTLRTEDGTVPLSQLIERAPEAILGPESAARFGGKLPYLFKVLDARKMLSIQAHPTREQAREGFARENAAGIPLQAPNRNYRDDNHKPEVHVALTEFWMLHGFRTPEQVAATLASVPELAALPAFPELRDLYGHVMTMPQEQVDAILDPLIARLERAQPADKDAPDFWALRAAREFPLPGGHRDRGIFSVYLLNLLHLRPGQGTYQPAGVLHAYLEGVNVELMANSDNVLRGGLTPKHVDVEELMRTLSFESGPSEVLEARAVSRYAGVYSTEAEEFELGRIAIPAEQSYAGRAERGPDALIVLEGTANAASGELRMHLKRGDIVFVPYGKEYTLTAGAVEAVLFKASVP